MLTWHPAEERSSYAVVQPSPWYVVLLHAVTDLVRALRSDGGQLESQGRRQAEDAKGVPALPVRAMLCRINNLLVAQ